MFTQFLYHLRSYGLRVSPTEWLALMRALVGGHSRASLSVFYHLARAVLIKDEALYDRYDRAFASHFRGIEDTFLLDEEILKWLENPVLPRELTPEEEALLQAMDLDTLREEFEKRLAEQDGRHDGGDRWIGTGGTSPFGHGGRNPAGMRVGGAGGTRSAVQIAGERRFRNLRHDRVLDTRQIGSALRRLRRLAKDAGPEELKLDETIDKSAREGYIDLVFGPSRQNKIKLLLLTDVGGSMDPHADVTERLFAAAHAATHFKAFKSYYFHNCVYGRVYTDMVRYLGPPTEEVLKQVDETWSVILVGDAWMAPHELVYSGGSIYYDRWNAETGLSWLQRIREKVPKSVWLNPEPQRIWDAPTVQMIRKVFPMFPLTLDGLGDAVDVLRGARANRPE